MRDIVLIVGMGRSGTSALAGVCSQLGVNFGKNQIGANQANPKGHFEQANLINANEALLKALWWPKSSEKPSWLKGDTPWQWLNPPRIEITPEMLDKIHPPLIDNIKKHLNNLKQEKGLIGYKDPRLCLLMPLWERILKQLSLNPRFIHIKRDRFAVARSLYKFWNFQIPQDKAYELIDLYESRIHEHLKGTDYLSFTYEKLLSDPKETAEKIKLFLFGIKPSLGELSKVTNFIDQKLNRSGS